MFRKILIILLCISTVFIFGCKVNNNSTDSPYDSSISSSKVSDSVLPSDSSSEKIPFASGEVYKFFSLDDFYLYAENNVRDTINFSQKPLTASNAEREILYQLVDILIKAEVFSPNTNKDLLEINDITVYGSCYIYSSDSLGYRIFIDQTSVVDDDINWEWLSITIKEYNDIYYCVKFEGTQNECISGLEFKIKDNLYVELEFPTKTTERQELKDASLPILSDLICDDISTIYDIIYPVISSLRNSYK